MLDQLALLRQCVAMTYPEAVAFLHANPEEVMVVTNPTLDIVFEPVTYHGPFDILKTLVATRDFIWLVVGTAVPLTEAPTQQTFRTRRYVQSDLFANSRFPSVVHAEECRTLVQTMAAEAVTPNLINRNVPLVVTFMPIQTRTQPIFTTDDQADPNATHTVLTLDAIL